VRRVAVLLALVLLLAPAPAAEEAVRIDPVELDLHRRFLGSAELRGRRPGTSGLEAAAAYLGSELGRLGLTGAGPRGATYLSFEADFTAPGPACRLTSAEPELTLTPGPDFLPLPPSPDGAAEGPLVFVGHGLAGPERDELAGLDLAGRIVLFVAPPAGPDRDAKLIETVDRLAGRGASAAVVVADPRLASFDRVTFANGTTEDGSVEERGAELLFHPADGGPRRTLGKDDFREVELDLPPRAIGTGGPTPAPSRRAKIPAVSVGGRAVDLLLGRPLTDILVAIDRAGRPGSYEVPGVRLRVLVEQAKERLPLRNVAARIAGADPRGRNESVVVAARYDAGDGAAAVLALAGALRRVPAPPRSITFLFLVGGPDGRLGATNAVSRRELPANRIRTLFGITDAEAPPFLAPFAAKSVRCVEVDLDLSDLSEEGRERALARLAEVGKDAIALASLPIPPVKPPAPKSPPKPTGPPTLAAARQARFAGRLPAAEASIAGALDAHPGDPELYLERARVRIAKKDYDGALADAENLDRLEKGDARGFLVRSEVALARGDAEAAARDLDRAVTMGSAEAMLTRALRRLEADYPEVSPEARQDLTDAIRAGGESAVGLCARGIFTAVATSNRPDDAIEWLGQAIDRDPLLAAAWLYRGATRVDADGDRAAAIRDLVRAEQLGARSPRLYFQRGLAELTEGMFSLSIRDFEAHVAKVPDPVRHAASLYNIACAHSLMGNRDEALLWLGRAVAAGFADADHARRDSDLENIRDDPRFEAILRSRRSD
jgi:tetratricopeptide (TPR) repeat protein